MDPELESYRAFATAAADPARVALPQIVWLWIVASGAVCALFGLVSGAVAGWVARGKAARENGKAWEVLR